MVQFEWRLAQRTAVALLVVAVTIGAAAFALAQDGTRDRDWPEPPAPVCEVTPIGAAVCSGATVTFTCDVSGGVPGYTYRWEREPYDGTPLSAAAELTLSGISAEASGQYRVVATDANGQSATSYATVTVCTPDEIALSAVADGPVCTISSCVLKACEGTLIELCAPGIEGYTWEWHGPEADGATTQCIYIYTPGTYYLTVTDAAGNQATCSREAPIVETPDCEISGPSRLCGAGTVEWCAPLPPDGVTYTYVWHGPEQDGATTRCIDIGTPGTYTVRVTADYLCWSECSKTLSVGDLDCTITGEEVICAGNTTEFCAPAGQDWTYLWDGPEQDGATSRCITVGTPGIYSVTVTDMISECEATCYKPLANYVLDCHIDGLGDCCPNDSVEWCAPYVDGWTYEWRRCDSASVIADTRCIWVSDDGCYEVTVTDPNGCEATCRRVLSVAPGPECSIDGDDTICLGETVEWCGPVAPDGETYTYHWEGPGDFEADTRCITMSEPGEYTLTVTDGEDCWSNCSDTLKVSTAPTCELVEPNPLPDCNSTGNHLSASVNGAVSTYAWTVDGIGWAITGGEHTPEITYNAGGYGTTGSFQLIVTNREGCPDTCTVEFGCEQREMNCTFTQGGWGSGCPESQQDDPMSTQPGCIRDHFFTEVFPTADGVILGGSPYKARWTTPRAVELYLPANGAVGVLRSNLTNPTTTPMGKLGSQLLALRLNREYSCAGVFYDLGIASTPTCYGEFVIPSTVECGRWFAGMTVDQFLALADVVVGGTPRALIPYGASLTNMHQTATCLNEMFDECDPYSITVSTGPGTGEAAEDGAVIMGAPSPTAETSAAVPAAFDVSQINPNPVNRGTTITYGLPAEGRVVIEIYDVQGAKVVTLVDRTQGAGYHSVYWDGTNAQGRTTGSGVYFCRGRFGDDTNINRKMIKLQ